MEEKEIHHKFYKIYEKTIKLSGRLESLLDDMEDLHYEISEDLNVKRDIDRLIQGPENTD